MFQQYLNAVGRENLFGERLAEHERREYAARQMYDDCRQGGATHMAAYALLVEECPDVADFGATPHGARGMERAPYRRYGQTWTQWVQSEAGL